MLMDVLMFVRYFGSFVHLQCSSLHRDMGYDGVVLESWSRWASYGVLHDVYMRKMVI